MIRLLMVLRGLFHGLQIFSRTPLVVGLIPDYFLKRKNWKLLKERCGSMGLRHEVSEYYDEFGSLHGSVRGYRVNVTVISNGTAATGTHITMDPLCKKRIASLTLDRMKPVTRPAGGEQDFATANPDFNYIFRTRRGDEGTASALAASPELLDRFVLFYAKWMFRFHGFWVELPSGGFRCSLNYGHPFVAYVPPERLREVLDDLAGLVAEFDEVMGAAMKGR